MSGGSVWSSPRILLVRVCCQPGGGRIAGVCVCCIGAVAGVFVVGCTDTGLAEVDDGGADAPMTDSGPPAPLEGGGPQWTGKGEAP